MSKKHKTLEGFEGFHRCGICDYCELNQGELSPNPSFFEDAQSRPKKLFYDKANDQYICEDCADFHRAIMQDFDTKDEENYNRQVDEFIRKLEQIKKGQRSPDYRQPHNNNPKGPPKKVTLPGITGINDGPKIDAKTLEKKKE